MRQQRLAEPTVKYSKGPYNKIKGNSQAIRITEGCPHNCPFCYEPQQFKIFEIPEIIKNNVLIYDMNLLAKPEALNIITSLPSKVNDKLIYYEMVCGIDYRFLTKQIAETMRIKRFGKIRIAWDWDYKDAQKIKIAIKKLIRAGYKPNTITIFMICNWEIPWNENCRKLDLCKVWNVKVADCYFDNQLSPNIQPEHWTPKQIKDFRRRVRKHNQLVNFGIDPQPKINVWKEPFWEKIMP